MPALTIAVMNGKGGVGKTTVSILIAGQMAYQGLATTLIDCDDRQNARRWWRSCEKNGVRADRLDVKSAHQASLIGPVFAAAEKTSKIIVCDLEGRNTELAAPIIQRAHIVLSPTQPTVADFAGVIQVGHFIKSLAERGGVSPAFATVVNRMSVTLRHSDVYQNLEKLSAQLGVRMLKTELWDRNCYRRMVDGAGTLQSMLGDTAGLDKARTEAAQFVSEIAELAASARKRQLAGSVAAAQ
jgi:chromosome partitioning protein